MVNVGFEMKQIIAIALLTLVAASCATSPVKSPNPEQAQYSALTARADRFTIRTGALRRRAPQVRELLDTRDPDLVQKWQQAFRLKPYADWIEYPDGTVGRSPSCRCGGEYTFTFLRGDELLIEFSIHHSHHIRSPQLAQRGDVNLTPESIRIGKEHLEALRKDRTTISWSIFQ